MGWRSKAAVTAAAVAGGLVSLRVHAFGLVEPTPVGVVWAYAFGALVCGLGALGLLVVVGLLRDAGADVSAMADPEPQNPVWWAEPRPSGDGVSS